MDAIARYNVERWRALAQANALYTRAAFDLNPGSAQELVDPDGRLGNFTNKDVLCLACGGGQQSAAFGILGANVTVLDISEEQLARDRETAAHYGLDVRTEQGDIRDLSRFDENSFDIVYHGYSLGFVPDPKAVFKEVARVIREGGFYNFGCANPFTIGITEADWDGNGYPLRYPYIQGEHYTRPEQEWVYDRSRHDVEIPPSREYRHTLSTLVSGLVETGFLIVHISDYADLHPDADGPPGTWDHFVSIAPPWLSFFTRYQPEILRQINQVR